MAMIMLLHLQWRNPFRLLLKCSIQRHHLWFNPALECVKTRTAWVVPLVTSPVCAQARPTLCAAPCRLLIAADNARITLFLAVLATKRANVLVDRTFNAAPPRRAVVVAAVAFHRARLHNVKVCTPPQWHCTTTAPLNITHRAPVDGLVSRMAFVLPVHRHTAIVPQPPLGATGLCLARGPISSMDKTGVPDTRVR